MDWIKSGCIFKANKQKPWMISHSAMPIPLQISGTIYRIYFSTRGERNNPQVGYIEIDINNPNESLKISEKPCISNGVEGFFDYNGVYSGSIVKKGDELWMYYSGRVNIENGMYHVSAGLAISNDGGVVFNKYSESPIHQRNQYDPWLVSTPFVMKYENNWKMWYLSGRGITRHSENEYTSHYDIRSAISQDGISWKSENKIHIPIGSKITNVAAPSIVRLPNGKFFMCFSFVEGDKGYQLGAAWSNDLEKWTICSDIFHNILSEEWEKTRCYPHCFIHENLLYIVYCGHNFGKEGIGLINITCDLIQQHINA
jgi:predicted GH43/DUF377 family glycosyl hydrolase